MALPELGNDLIERIQGAPADVSDAALARDLGIHRNTVRKYRRLRRQERQEIAREVIARHVESNIPDALADLTELRQMSKEKFAESGDSRDGRLWLDAIKTTLEHVKPDDAAIDAAIECGLAQLANAREATPFTTSRSAEGTCTGAVH